MQRLVENSSDLLARHEPDGTYLYVSPSSHALLGFQPAELIGSSPYELIHPKDFRQVIASHRRVLENPDIDTVAHRYRHRDGHYVWMETKSRSIRHPESGEAVEIQTSSRDITQRKTHEAVIALSFDHAPIGMALLSTDGIWLHVNDAFASLVDRPVGALEGTAFCDVLHPDHADRDATDLGERVSGAPGPYSTRTRFMRPNGTAVWVEMSVSLVTDANDNPDFFVLHVQDATEQRAREQEVEHLLSRDALTGLSNRRAFEQALAAVLRNTAPLLRVVVGFVDIDDFKDINDVNGHLAGDQMLRAVAQHLTRAVHHGDIVARIGGDEFVFATLLRDGETQDTVRTTVRSSLTKVVVGEAVASASVGVAMARPGDTAAALIARADHDMYAHKAESKAARSVVLDDETTQPLA